MRGFLDPKVVNILKVVNDLKVVNIAIFVVTDTRLEGITITTRKLCYYVLSNETKREINQ